MESGDIERHGGLDVVPRIAVTASNHGIIPEGSCSEAIDSAVTCTSSDESTSARIGQPTHPATNSGDRAANWFGAVHRQALATLAEHALARRVERGPLMMSHSRNFL